MFFTIAFRTNSDLFSVSDVAAWMAERKASYPTKARTAAKKAAEQSRNAEVGEGQKPVSNRINKDEEKAEKLRRQLAKVERKLEKRKREANDEGDEMRVDGADSDSSSSEDEKPESQSTRKTASFLPPPPVPPITRADPTAHCKYYSTGGVCGKKGKCRFKHDPQIREQALQEQALNGGRMTLKQRLLRNDKDQEDLAVVQSIVTMRAAGKLQDARQSGHTSTNGIASLSALNLTHPLPVKVEPAFKVYDTTPKTVERLRRTYSLTDLNAKDTARLKTAYSRLRGYGNPEPETKPNPRIRKRR